jgi:hypothetical protein
LSFFNSVVSWFFRQRVQQIELFMYEPIQVQHDTFADLIGAAAHTEWGEKFEYNTIENFETYKNRVPIQDYESLKPFIERNLLGEQNLLWHSPVNWFAKSSGTTSDKSKFIPVSQESLDECHFKGGKDLLTIYCNNHPDTKIFSGKGLIMGGSHQINPLNESVSYGDLSAVLNQNMPWLGQVMRTPDLSIALINDWEQKLEKMIEATMLQDITHIAGVPTWTLIFLNKILEQTKASSINEIWKNFELYIHGGVSFTPYQQQFRKLIKGSSVNYYQTYNASEGFFAIQDIPNADDMLLMLDYGIFYEFIPLENCNDINPITILLDSVIVGKTYAVIITTNGGLWRYKLGDTVTFTTTYPFRIKVAGRTKNFINAFGEELMVHNADDAIAFACAQTNAIVKDYTACPIYMEVGKKGCHEWLIEFEKSPSDLNFFIENLDTHLKKINSDYEAKRQLNLALTAPLIKPLVLGSFYAWLKSKNKIGGQHKVPRLSNDRIIVEEIKKFLQIQ